MQRFTGRLGVMGEPVNFIELYLGKIVVERLNGERLLIKSDEYVDDPGVSMDGGASYREQQQRAN